MELCSMYYHYVSKMRKSVITVILVVAFVSLQTADAVIISPCKVQNMITQPKYATSLKTRNLVNIVQMPPVFVQNVMVGICENHNQNISSGRPGEFFQCEQRYSAVEVYIAEASSVPLPSQNSYQSNPNTLNEINYIRESVIIESGCDFTFNLLPLIMNLRDMEGHQQSPPPPPPQQTSYLRSPYHPNMPGLPGNQRQPPPLMQPPATAVPVPVLQNPQAPPQLTYPAYIQGRSDDEEDQVEVIDEKKPEPIQQPEFTILK